MIVGLVAPAIIIVAICLTLVPGPTVSKSTPKSLIWKRKLWEWNTGWMGLGLALAVTFFITQGMKLLFGKPRPDLIARCDPDLENISDYLINTVMEIETPVQMVTYKICRQKDLSILNDGFMSFPSGHASCECSLLSDPLRCL